MSSSKLSGRLAPILAFVLLANLFFFHQVGSLGSVLIRLAFFILVILIWAIRGVGGVRVVRVIGLVGGTVMAVFAAITLVRANGMVQFLTHLASWFTIILSIYLLATEIPFVRSLMELVLAPVLIIVEYVRGIGRLGRLGQSGEIREKEEKRTSLLSVVRPIVVGLVIGVPVVMVILVLLRGADPIFSATLDKFFNLSWLKTIPQRIFFSAILFLALLPLLHLVRKKEFTSPISFVERLGWVHEMSVVVGMVALVIGAFLVIQWPYVFVRVAFETSLSKYGVKTYSEYVQRGFIELLIVSFIVYGVVWLGRLGLLGKKIGQKSILPVLQLVVLGEMAVFIASIFRRIWLYQEFHGWSIVRIYGGFFLVWVALMTLTLALRHIAKLRWIYLEAGLSLGLLVILGFFNAENFIVINHPPTVNKRIDYVYLSRMSPDGYEGWKKAYDFAQNILIDKKYQDKPVINREERREIAYAGLVLQQLTRNYHILLHQYGSPADLQSYYTIILRKELMESQTESERLALYQKSYLSQQFPTAIPTPPYSATELGNRIDEEAKTKKQLDEVKKKFDQGDLNSVITHFYVDQYPGPTYFEPDSPDLSYNFYHFWYTAENDTLAGRFPGYPGQEQVFDRLDHLFIWNQSAAKAYANIRRDIPQEELFALQKRFGELATEISKQTSSEREYEIDISFSTPFLEPL